MVLWRCAQGEARAGEAAADAEEDDDDEVTPMPGFSFLLERLP